MDSFGFLIVNARTALGALPVGGAAVHVTGTDTDLTVLTDPSGVSERMRLPAPPLENSLTATPEGLPYATYDVSVSAEGYYKSESRAVPVFPGIVSVQSVNLIPIAGFGMPEIPKSELTANEGIPFSVEGNV